MKKYIIVLLLFLLSFGLFGCGREEPKKLEDLTNKEFEQFLELQMKQQQKEFDNAPAFK